MKAVSEVIAIILILMITISLAGLAYMFMSTTMSDVTSSASSTVDTTTSSMLTSFRIESVDIAKVYVRNTGQNALSRLTVYVNDEPATYNVTPTSIAAGDVGTVTIYSFIPDGSTVKVTSPNGFSASKVAHPCEKAVGCWKFDETSGMTAYDSSPYGNDGTLVNGPAWTSGRYGNGLQFDGTDDYVNAGNASSLNITSKITLSAWIKTPSNNGAGILSKYSNSNNGKYTLDFSSDGYARIHVNNYAANAVGSTNLKDNQWHFIVGTYDSGAGGTDEMKIYVDGVLVGIRDYSAAIQTDSNSLLIGRYYSSSYTWNGTIDEVRIYNRAIY